MKLPVRAAVTARLAVASLAFPLLAGPAAAIDETEPNDACASAQELSPAAGVLVRGSIENGDVDAVSVPVDGVDLLTAHVIVGDEGAFHDPVVEIFDAGGTPVQSDDDSGPGFLPAVRALPDGATGRWCIAVSGFANEHFDYELVVAVGPSASPPDPLAGDVWVIEGTLDADGTDDFAVDAGAGNTLVAAIYDRDADGPGAFNDPVVTLNPSDDDDGPGFLASLFAAIADDGAQNVAVSHFGGAGDAFAYRLVLTASAFDDGEVLVCDTNDDDFIDIDDIAAIFQRFGEPADPGDPADFDGNGLIDPLDARACVLACPNPNCERPTCGLLGVEPLPLLALGWWRRRVRRWRAR